ncbi:hypothetical protein [Streptomyces sp. NBC_01363]|uniref:hypothetical protein n=1 Tax=Streptomyces sp. NBC_01363 TaxID=2903840 RepID=UPI00224FCFFE|nr:hypothetical protein [Streptomyces sp. NBC_01363]MCX4730632.1 hypothetical protein [Streptomyces sp. NBC_01363]
MPRSVAVAQVRTACRNAVAGMRLHSAAHRCDGLAGRRPVAAGVRLGQAAGQSGPVQVAMGPRTDGKQQGVHAGAAPKFPRHAMTTAAACCMRSASRP